MRPANRRVRLALAARLGLAALLTVGPVRALAADPSSTHATTAPLTGSVELSIVDAATGEPVPWANVVRLDGGGGWLAGEDGVVRVPSVPAGPLRVRALHVAYGPSEPVTLDVPVDGRCIATLALVAEAYAMPPVEVRADRQASMRSVASGVRRLTATDALALPNPQDDVFQMIRVLPGVSTDDVGSEFHLRGGGVDETLVRIDGMEVRNLFHGRDFGGITGILPLGVVRTMDVYPGGFPARYGGRVSGAIDVSLRSSGPEGLHGVLGADAVSARALAEVNGGDGSLLVSAREGYLDQVLDVLQNEAVIHPDYRDLLVRAVHRPDVDRSISFNWLRSEDHLFYEDGVDLHFVDADYVDHYLWTTGQWTLSDRFALEGTLHGASSNQLRRIEGDGRDDHRHRRAGGRMEASWLAPGQHLLRFGGQTDREWGSYGIRGTEVVRISSDGSTERIPDFVESGTFRRWRSAAFLQDEWRPFRPLALIVGVRGSHDTDSESYSVDPRTSAALELGGGLTLQGAWGRYSQAPSRELGGSTEQPVISDRAEHAEHRLVGLEKTFGATRVGVDGYEKRFRQLDGVVTRTLDDQIEHHPITHGSARGLEVWLTRRTKSMNWWLAYALGRSEWGNDDRTFSRDFDRLHAFTLTNTFRIGEAWDVGTTWTWHTGNPYTEQSWRRDGKSGTWVLDEGEPNSERLPDYHRVDLRVRRHFRFDGWQMAVYAEGLNLTNHDNVLFYSWAFRKRGERLEPERITRTGVPGVPSVGLEVRF